MDLPQIWSLRLFYCVKISTRLVKEFSTYLYSLLFCEEKTLISFYEENSISFRQNIVAFFRPPCRVVVMVRPLSVHTGFTNRTSFGL